MVQSTASRPFSSRTASVLGMHLWHRPHARRWARVVSLVTVFSFLMPYVAVAFEAQPSRSSQPKSSSAQTLQAGGAPVIVPVERGRVLNSFRSRSEATVVFIHDLHCNYEVQDNIAEILRGLHQKNGLRLVGVEGESRAVDVSVARFPVDPVRDRVGEYFLKRGRITGPEYLAGTTLPDLALEGIESPALYEQNKEVLFGFLNDESQGYCEDLKSSLERLKSPLYTVELAKLDHLRQQYDAEGVSLESYCTQLLGEASRLNLSLLPFPVLNLYASEHRLPQQEDADYDRLLADAEGLDRAIRERLYTSPDQRQLDQYLRLVGIIESLISISATAAELEHYRAHREEYSVAAIVKYLDNVYYRNALDLDLEAGVAKLDEHVKKAAAFYDLADRRSEAFVQNLLRLMELRQVKLAALITGGYHSRLVEESLQRHGVSYLTVKPRITRPDAASPYFSILRNERPALESLLAKNANLFAPASAFNDAVFKLYYAAVLGVEDLRYRALEQQLSGPALEAAWKKDWQDYAAHRDEIEVDFTTVQTNARRDIFVFALRGTDFLVVLRPTRVEQSAPYSVVASEDLGNGYQFQILPRAPGTAAAQAQLEQILGVGALASSRVGLEQVQAPLARALQPGGAAVAMAGAFNGLMVAIGIQPRQVPGANLNPALLQSTWPQRLRQLGAAGSWAALRTRLAQGSPAALTLVTVILGGLVIAPVLASLPFTAPVLLQVTLLAGLFLSAYFLIQHPRLPSGVRVAIGGLVALVVSFSTFQVVPEVQQLLAAWIPFLSPTVRADDLSPRSLWSMAGSVPLVGMLFMGMMRPDGGRTGMPEEDRVGKALAWVRTHGYGLSEHEADALRAVVEAIDAQAGAAPASEVGQMSQRVEGLALLALARYTGTGAAAVADQVGQENMEALARDWTQGEALAKQVLKGDLPENVQGQSFLAQVLRARRGATVVIGQAETELLHPERLLAESVSPQQAKAIARVVKERNLSLVLHGPVFNPILGFHPNGLQAVAAYERLVDLARRLRARTVDVRAALTPAEQADIAVYARQGEPAVAVTFGLTLAERASGSTAALVDQVASGDVVRFLTSGFQHFLINGRSPLDALVRLTSPEAVARLGAAQALASQAAKAFGDQVVGLSALVKALEQVPAEERQAELDTRLKEAALGVGGLVLGTEEVLQALNLAKLEGLDERTTDRVKLIKSELKKHIDTLAAISGQLQVLGSFTPAPAGRAQLGAVTAALQPLVATLEQAGVRLDLPTKTPEGTLAADPLQLQQTLTYLVEAAVREGAKTIQVRFETSEGQVRILVEDDARSALREADLVVPRVRMPLFTVSGRSNIAEYTYADRFSAAYGGTLTLGNNLQQGITALVSLPFAAAPTGGALRGAEGETLLAGFLRQGLELLVAQGKLILQPGQAVGELSTFLGSQLVAALQAYFTARGVEEATIEQREADLGTAARPMSEVRGALAARLRAALDQAGEEERAAIATRLDGLDVTDPQRSPIRVLSPSADLVGQPTDLDLERLGIFNLNGAIYLTDALYRRWVANALTDEDFDAILLHESLEILGFSHDRAVELVTAVTGLDQERLVAAAGLTELGPLTVRVPERPDAAVEQLAAAAALSRPVVAGAAPLSRAAVPLRLMDRLSAFGQTLRQVLRVRPSMGVPALRIGIQGGLLTGLQAFFAPAWTTALAFLGAFFSEGLAGAVLLNPEASVDSVRRWLPILSRLPATADTVGIMLTFENTQALVQVPRALAPRIGRTLRTIGISVLDELNRPNNRFRLGFGGAA